MTLFNNQSYDAARSDLLSDSLADIIIPQEMRTFEEGVFVTAIGRKTHISMQFENFFEISVRDLSIKECVSILSYDWQINGLLAISGGEETITAYVSPDDILNGYYEDELLVCASPGLASLPLNKVATICANCDGNCIVSFVFGRKYDY